MKSAGTTLHRALDWWVWCFLHEILFPLISLILDHFDVGRRGLQRDIPLRCASQLLELTLVPAAPQGTTPRCR
jgi:hypothetical protein